MTAGLQSKCTAVFPISNASHHSKGSKLQTGRGEEPSKASMSSVSFLEGRAEVSTKVVR